jgi:parvulin-like peptidyl-prolyl isomerase
MSSDTVARVEKATITKAVFDRWMAIKPPEGGRLGERDLRRRVLSYLVLSAWTVERAAELGFAVTNADVDRELESVEFDATHHYSGGAVNREAELQRLLDGQRESHTEQLQIVRVHLLAAKVEQQQTQQAEREISSTEVIDYYARHRRRFVLPERRDVKAIMTWKEAGAEKAKRELQTGKSFTSVARRFNEQPSEGGLRLGFTPVPGTRKRYEHDFFAAPPHVLIGPRKEVMYYIFEVVKVTRPRQQSLEQVEPTVRRQLIDGELHYLLTDIADRTTREWRSKTRCATGYSGPECGGRL